MYAVIILDMNAHAKINNAMVMKDESENEIDIRGYNTSDKYN